MFKRQQKVEGKVILLREAVYQRKLKAARKRISLTHMFRAVVVARKRLFCLLCGDVLKSRLGSYCIASLVSVCACLPIYCDEQESVFS